MKLDLLALYDAISEIEKLDDDVIEFRFRIDLPRTPVIQPYTELYRWEKTGSDAPPIGWFTRAGIVRQQPLGLFLNGKELKLCVDLSIGHSSDGLFGKGEGLAYYRAIISTDIPINDQLTISPSIVGQLPGKGQPSDRSFVDHSRVFYNLSFKYVF